MKYLVFVIIMFSLSTAKSQLRILPGVGVSYGFFNLSKHNRYDLRINPRFSDIFYSIILEKKNEQRIIGVEANYDQIHFGIKTREVGGYYMGRRTGRDIYRFKAYYGNSIFKPIKLRKRPYGIINYLSDVPVIEQKNIYLTIFEFIPIIGFSINKVEKVNWKGSEDGYEELSYSGRYDVKYYYGKDRDIVSSFWGVSLNLGCRIQFKHNGKDRLALHVLWNQGITKHIETHVLYKNKLDSNWKKVTITQRGSSIIIYASYPIAIANKKGERRKDRKLNKL